VLLPVGAKKTEMPSTSKKQHNFMEAIAHSPSFAKKAGVPQSVGSDFAKADKGRKFAKGGDTMATKGVNPFAQKSKKAGEAKGKPKMGGMPMKDGGGVKKMAAGGMFRSSANGIAQRGKTKAAQPKMAGGGKC
jgi:hypothetical protein